MYRAGQKAKNTRRKRLIWLVVFVLMLLLIAVGVMFVKSKLKPQTTLTQAKPVTNKVSYDNNAIKHYDEPDFGIDIPSAYKVVPREPGPYKRFDWQNSRNATNGEVITVYEDIIPTNFAVNRVLIVESQGDHVDLKGNASENCSTFTKNLSAKANQVGAPAKWQGIDFLCDQNNTSRDVIGTSSVDGINTVVLKGATTSATHKFFFTYTNHSINPDYEGFYRALSSLRVK